MNNRLEFNYNDMNTGSWIKDIDSITTAFRQQFGDLSEEALNWKPSPDRWSIAQNLEHLIIINQSYFPAIQQLQEGTYKAHWLGKFGFITQLFGKMLLKAVQPDSRKKTKTFAIWQPASSRISSDIIDRFEQHQSTLKQMINSSSALLEKGAVISSPANKNVVYKLETAFDILIAHEKRHLEQAREVLTMQQEK